MRDSLFISAPRFPTPAYVLALVFTPASLLAYVIYLAGATMPALIVGGTACAVSILLVPELGWCAYLAALALDPVFLVRPGQVLTPGKLAGVLIFLVYLIRIDRPRPRIQVSRKAIVAFLMFGVYGLVASPLAVAPSVAMRYSAQIILQVLLIIAAVHMLDTSRKIGLALGSAVLAGLIGASMLLFAGTGSSLFRRATLGGFANPNTTALALAVSLTLIPAAWVFTRGWGLKVAYCLAAPIVLAATMKTGSRAALIAIAAALLFCPVLTRRAGVWRRMVLPTVGILVLTITAAYVLRSNVLDPKSRARIERLIHRDDSPGSESRLYIWDVAFTAYLEQPWGFGYGNTQYKLAQTHGLKVDAHSTYISALVDGGPIAFVLFLYGLWWVFRSIRTITQPSTAIAASLLFCFVAVSALPHTIHFAKWFWIPITVCLLLAEHARGRSLPRSPTLPPGR